MSVVHSDAEEADASLGVRRAEALLKTGALQSAIFNSANFSSIATDAKGVIQIFNVGAERMLGYMAADVVNKITPADISDPHELVTRAATLSLELATPIAPGFEALVFKASRGIEDIYELTYIRRDGSRFPAVVSVTALRDAQNAIIGYLLIGTDNTARKKAEEALLQTGALQRAIFNSANFSSIATDASGVIQIFNVGAERMLGYTAAEVVNKITPADISDFREVIARATALSLELGTAITPGFEALVFKASRGIEDIYELTYIRKDRSRFPAVVSVTALRDAQDTIIGYLLIGTDNTARKKAEEALIQAGALQSAIFNSANFSSIATDAKGVIQIFNVGAERMMGYTAAEVVNKITPADLHDPEEVVARAAALSLEYGTPITPGFEALVFRASRGIEDIYELTKVRKDGSRFAAVDSVTALRDAQNAIIGYLLIGTDNTVRREAAVALEQIRQDELRFKDEFLSHVSHELRSPLTAIKQFTSILIGGLAGELNAEQHDYQQIVLKNIHQLQSMIDDLLEVTGLETGKLTVHPESVSVDDAAADTFNTLQGPARAKGISLSSDLAADLPHVYADHTRLRQILIILFDNAIKFTPSGGSVQLRAMISPEKSRFLLVEVTDTGGGIAPELVGKVFDRLYQVSERSKASRKGLGLGLYICKELVTRQGGSIWVKSPPGEGCTFSFTLPVFSLDNVIGPLLKNHKWPTDSVALVTMEAAWLEDSSAEHRAEWTRDARRLVRRCLLPDLDVLLPRMSSGGQAERLFVAAFADDKGASVLADRIRDQFDRLPHVNMTVSVSYKMLVPRFQEAGASADSLIASMAGRIGEAIKAQPISGGIHHE